MLDYPVTTCMGNFCSPRCGDVFDRVFSYCPFYHEMSWMRSGTLLSQFLRVFLHTLSSLISLFAKICLTIFPFDVRTSFGFCVG